MRDLASKAGLSSPAFIADLERGYRFPSPGVLARLAAALDVPKSDLRGHDPRPPIPEFRDLVRQNPAWANSLRKLVDAANQNSLTPQTLNRLIDSALARPEAQKSLPFWD